jgi:hypothetical protein
MPTYDRPSDLQAHTTLPGVGTPAGTYAGQGMSPSLSEQTPGLDRTRRVRDLAMRPVSWAREQPALAASILGGLALIGLGTLLAFTLRRPSRYQRLNRLVRRRAGDAYGWMRARVA